MISFRDLVLSTDSDASRISCSALSDGANINSLQSTSSSKDFRFRIPPLPEQQRIVGILDEAFEGIATAKANAEKNLQNARALFESHLQSVFTQRGKGWVEKTLGDVCIDSHGSTSSEACGTEVEYSMCVRMGNLHPRRRLDSDAVADIDRDRLA